MLQVDHREAPLHQSATGDKPDDQHTDSSTHKLNPSTPLPTSSDDPAKQPTHALFLFT